MKVIDILNLKIIDILNLTIALLSLFLTVFFGIRSRRSDRRLRGHIEQRFQDIVRSLLRDNRLRETRQVVAIAENLAAEYGISRLTPEQITILLRRLALQYEDADPSQQAALGALEVVRKELDPKGPPLMSIAYVDVGFAFWIVVFVTFLVSVSIEALIGSGLINNYALMLSIVCISAQISAVGMTVRLARSNRRRAAAIDAHQ